MTSRRYLQNLESLVTKSRFSELCLIYSVNKNYFYTPCKDSNLDFQILVISSILGDKRIEFRKMMDHGLNIDKFWILKKEITQNLFIAIKKTKNKHRKIKYHAFY